MSESILVTGATGFAGSHLLDLLSRERTRHERDGSDVLHAWSRTAQPEHRAVRWTQVDMLDRGSVEAAVADARPTVIYHCAGAAHAGASWRDAARTLEANLMTTHHLLRAVAALAPTARVLIPGSALVYRPSDEPLSETSTVGPTTPYATSKLAQELLGRQLARDEGLAVLVARAFNHAGPRQDPSFAASSFARQLARIEAGQSPPVIRVGNLDARRDVTDVRDVVRAYVAIVAQGTPGRIYNVCSGRAIRIADLLDGLIRISRAEVRIERDSSRLRPSETPFLLGSARRLEAETGWRPSIPLDRTLTDVLDYWRRQVAPPAS